MSTPNPLIYGAPSTWINSKNFAGITTAPDTLHAKHAQICGIWINPDQPTYDNYEKGSLQWGILGNKITAQQPIDKSITAIGQGRDSAYHRLGVYANQQREGEENPQIRSIGTATYDTDVLNFVPFDARCPTSSAVYANRAFNQRYNFKKSSEFVWSPDGEYNRGTNKMNGTFNISPFTYYESRTILLQIVVSVTDLTTAELVANPPTSPPATHTYNLETWKNDYSDHSITAAFLNMRYLNSYNSTTGDMQYRLASYGGDTYQKAAFMCLDKLTISQDGGTNKDIYHYGMYADNSNIARIVLFQSQAGLSKWDGSNELVALMPFDHVFGNTIKFGSTQVWYQIPYSNDTYEALMCATACFGCPFTPSKATTSNSNITFNQSFTDADLCLPIITESGIAEGDYTRGTDNLDNPFIDLKTPYDYDYEPSKPADRNTYSNTTGFNYITEGAAMTVRYVLDGTNVNKLLSDLWTINASIAQGGDFEYFDGKIKDEYLTTNPIDCIVSLIRYPFNIPYQIQPLQSYVKLGKTSGTAKGWTTVYISNQINFQGINIFPRFGNCFLDYEPYTIYELYVPFCGTTKIRAADILGHTLNVTMLIDLITGSCTAYVKADQLVIETLQGSCGVQQQISGTDTATMNANIYNGILAQKQAKAGMIAQGASALLPSSWVNPVGYAAKGEQAETSYKQATFAIEHMETPVHTQGAASPLLGWIQEFDARLMIYYPEGDVIDGAIPPSFKPAPLAAFGHLKGFATVTPGTVGAFRSSNAAFLSGDIIADDIPCTLSERNRIKSMFADGVYLPPL